MQNDRAKSKVLTFVIFLFSLFSFNLKKCPLKRTLVLLHFSLYHVYVSPVKYGMIRVRFYGSLIELQPYLVTHAAASTLLLVYMEGSRALCA